MLLSTFQDSSFNPDPPLCIDLYAWERQFCRKGVFYSLLQNNLSLCVCFVFSLQQDAVPSRVLLHGCCCRLYSLWQWLHLLCWCHLGRPTCRGLRQGWLVWRQRLPRLPRGDLQSKQWLCFWSGLCHLSRWYGTCLWPSWFFLICLSDNMSSSNA